MIIMTPPAPVEGAPNLGKGLKVFDLCKDYAEDKVFHRQTASQIETAREILSKIHGRDFVNDTMSGSRPNGYGDFSKSKNDHALESCAVMVRAAELSGAVKAPVFAPVSGFHHAGKTFSGGFCTFNGLVAAAESVRRYKSDARVLIIDGDGHHGDGTVDLIDGGHRDWLANCDLSFGAVNGDPDTANKQLFKCLGFGPWDLILYQAGADSHKDDPYQAGYLTDERWDMRDVAVFNYCKTTRTPLVFCLAGGYNGAKTLTLHNRTFLSALQVYEPESTRLVSAPTLSTGKAETQDPQQ